MTLPMGPIFLLRMYDQSDITCMVDNEEGQAEASTSLDIKFPPTILLHPRFLIIFSIAPI